MPKSILVTGAGGYIGCVLVPMLISKGYSVIAVDRFFFETESHLVNKNLKILKKDTRNLDKNDFHNIDCVIDLAALSNDPSGEHFQLATHEINFEARKKNATLAKKAGVDRYILASSCSVYGFNEPEALLNENSPTHPLTTYAEKNLEAENALLALCDPNFTVIVLRQATLFGVSQRMRFDLAVNAMVLLAVEKRNIPMMRDGDQWRPMLHVSDAASAQLLMVEIDKNLVQGEIFNVGANDLNYKIKDIAALIQSTFDGDVSISLYGDPDKRSYVVDFQKIKDIGFECRFDIKMGIEQIVAALQSGAITPDERTNTLNWYRQIIEWNERINRLQISNKIF